MIFQNCEPDWIWMKQFFNTRFIEILNNWYKS